MPPTLAPTRPLRSLTPTNDPVITLRPVSTPIAVAPTPAAPTLLAKKVKGIVENRVDLRRRVCDFSHQLLRGRDLDLANVRIVVANTLIGVREAITGMNPDDRATILRQVFDGLGDGLAALAQAQTLLEAPTAPRVGDLSIKLRGMEQSFLETCLAASETFTDPMRREFKTMVTQARQSGTRVAPAAKSAIEFLDERLAQSAGRGIAKRAVAAMVPKPASVVSTKPLAKLATNPELEAPARRRTAKGR